MKIDADSTLAVDGGAPVRATFLPFHQPSIDADDERAVVEALRSGWITTGPKTKSFERVFATYTGAGHCVAVNSCTAALHLGLEAVGVGPGDEVITSPVTFASTANVVVHRGARPVFVDVEADTLNIDPNAIDAAITTRTKAVIPVDFAGQPCDLDAIMPAIRDALADTSTALHLRHAFDHLTAQDPLNRILEAEFGGIFADQVLTFVDRLSMAHALEVRSPFLDTDVVEFVASLPGRLKICNGETKHLLKKAALRYFPEEMIRRPKEGFLMPITAWLLGHLQPWVRETLSPERLRLHGLFDSERVQRLVDRLREPGADYVAVNRVLVLAIFQEWYELYLA